jgi:thiol peroxidase
MKDVTLDSYKGKRVVLNIYPSIDTSTCAASVREFNRRAGSLNHTVVLCISRDLPYAMTRFCAAEGIENVVTLSDFRYPEFADKYGVMMANGRMKSLFARVVIILDEQGKITYEELVPVIGQEPDYDAALKALNAKA